MNEVQSQAQIAQSQVEDLRLVIERKKGIWSCEFVNMWLPRDVHQAQRHIGLQYHHYRKGLVASLNRSRAEEKKKLDEQKVRGREEKASPTSVVRPSVIDPRATLVKNGIPLGKEA